MNDCEKIAEMLFPNISKTPDYYESLYPPRSLPEGARVTRVAPSPTGYLHLGVLYMALCNRMAASADGSVFYVRIEDTDKKREVAGGAGDIIGGIAAFGIKIDEGFTGENRQTGDYGPYRQSDRKEIYQTFAKELVKRGLAYPCFCTEEDLALIREKQEAAKVRTGYYGEWAECRSLTLAQTERNLAEHRPFVIRLKSPGGGRVAFDDCVKGRVEAPENDEDFVLLKSDGIPTYHFAHVIDDHLMRTTHVIRGDEWLSSTPKHLQLFRMFGWRPPKYAHAAPILKSENGGKRKISKRKDPEAAVKYFFERGYEPESVIEYLMTVLSSEYEPWRRANPGAPYGKFPFAFKKMSVSGALFDGDKLDDVSKDTVSRFSSDEVVKRLFGWAEKYDPEFYGILAADPGYTKKIFAIDRDVPKPRKDIAKWSDAKNYAAYFYGELYTPCYDLPENISPATAKAVLTAYLAAYTPTSDRAEWFSRVKAICPAVGFAAETREYRQNPGGYLGSAGDAGTVIRIAVTGRRNTPDLCAVMDLLGEKICRERISAAINHYETLI